MKPYDVGTKVYLSAFPNREFEIMTSYSNTIISNGTTSQKIHYTCYNHKDRMTINSVHENVTPKNEYSIDYWLEKRYDAKIAYDLFGDPYYLELISTYDSYIQSHSSIIK